LTSDVLQFRIRFVAHLKRKAVFAAAPEQLEQLQAVVRSGRYRTASEFLREAVAEKLQRLRRQRLAEQVASYCARGHAGEDRDLVDLQALDADDS